MNESGNQEFLSEWDQYQKDWLDNGGSSSKRAIILPITVDIDNGVISRDRIKGPEIQNFLLSGTVSDDRVRAAMEHYVEYFASIDGAQLRQESASLPTPLDLNIETQVLHMFYFPRENWKFTDHTQFSVSNMNQAVFSEAFKVVGTFAGGQGLIVLNKFLKSDAGVPVTAKYNLHLTISQTENGQEYATDIIIDPGVGNNGSHGPD